MEDAVNEKPLEPETLSKLIQELLKAVGYPSEKSSRPRLLVVFGPPGSGKTELVRRIVALIPSAAHAQANDVRHVLRHVKDRTYRWGQNVRDILKQVAKTYLASGYDVVLDGSGTDPEDRRNIEAVSRESGAPFFFVHIMTSLDTAVARERTAYERRWREDIDRFGECRVNTTDKMVQNVKDRHPVHERLKASEIPNLLAEVDNNGTLTDLNRIARDLVGKFRAA